MNKDTTGAELICEFLETAFHLVLYVRGIYPNGVFKKKSKYNVGTMVCTHPEVMEYLEEVCNSLLGVICIEPVERIVLCITTEDGHPLEQFVFELGMLEEKVNSAGEALDIEACFRAFLLKLNMADACLKPLPKDCTFQILTFLKEGTSDVLELNQDCAWVRISKDEQPKSSDFLLIPLKSYRTKLFTLQCFVQEREDKDRVSGLCTPDKNES